MKNELQIKKLQLDEVNRLIETAVGFILYFLSAYKKSKRFTKFQRF